MMITGALDKSLETIISAANNLPSVRLIVMDDWCDSSGKIPKFQLDLISRLSNSISPEIRLLLISKGTVDASGKRVGEIFARAENYFVKEGYEIWTFSRSSNGHHRILNISSNSTTLKIVDSGLESVT
jgi:hypothetical protein